MADKLKRNDPCHCGSGKKYKNCCQQKDENQISSKMGLIGIVLAIVISALVIGLIFSSSDGPQNCPPGTVWSEAHQHCH